MIACSRALLVGLALLLGSACGDDEPGRPPNLVLVSVDTLRADHLGAWGYDRATSPALDAWMEQAVRFADAQAQSSWTLASFASTFTSQYTSTHECWTYRSRLAPSHVTLAERLRDAGWDTAAIVNHVFLGKLYGLGQGFDDFDDELVARSAEASHRAVTSERVTEKGIAWLAARKESKSERPFFLWIHYFDPHSDYLAHDGISELFGTEEDEDLYDGEIAYTDRHIGAFLDALDELSWSEDTVVIFLADHGEEWRDHGRLGHGHALYDELTRVPFAIRAPGFPPSTVRETVAMIDVVPTSLELLGLPRVPGLAGESLVPALRGQRLRPRPVMAELGMGGGDELLRSLILDRWKLIVNQKLQTVELYDRRADPQEQTSVVLEEGKFTRRLVQELDAAVARAQEAGRGHERAEAVELDEGLLQELGDLGYVEGLEDED